MTVVPLTQASHRLGIDAKTLRRWLAEAQFPLQPDPQDARKPAELTTPAVASGKTPMRSPRPAPPAPRVRPPTKAPSKPAHVLPRVEAGANGHYVVICPKKGLLPLEPDTPAWFAWVAEQESFRFVGKEGHFTAHHWWRVPHGAWRAHRSLRNHSYVLRLAPNHELSIAVLERAAQELQAHLA